MKTIRMTMAAVLAAGALACGAAGRADGAQTGGIDVDFLVKMLSIPSETGDMEANGRCTEFLAEWLLAQL